MQRRFITVIFVFVVQASLATFCGRLPLWGAQESYAADVLLRKGLTSGNTANKQELKNYLLARRFDVLEMELGKLQDGYRNGEHDDRLLDRAFQTFDSTDPRYQVLLDAWVQARPKSAIALTARGYYYSHLGAVSRGTAFANDTLPEKFQAMEKFLEKAAADLSAATGLDNGISVAFGRLIRLAKVIGKSKASEAVLSTGLRTNPSSYFIRAQYLGSLQPKWGGSLEEVEHFLTTFDGKSAGNPALAALRGYPDYVKADVSQLNGEDEKAVAHYTQAINLGLPVHTERGRILDVLGRSSEALEDFRIDLASDPQDVSALEARGAVYVKKKEYELALQDYNEAIAWDPLNPHVLLRRSYVHQLLKRDQDALADLRASLQYDSFNAYAYEQIGSIEMSLKNPEAAKQNFKKAIDLKPDDPSALYHYLGALYSLKECTIEIPYKAYLKACSTSDSAYCSQDRLSWANGFYRYVKNNPKSGCK
jgi:tetratricopeptide (TPR) repeat protein